MTKRTDKNTTKQFTSRIHKQHSSLVITVPKGLCEMLSWSRGDMLLFEAETGESAAIVGKLSLRGSEDGRDQENTDRKDNSRGT